MSNPLYPNVRFGHISTIFSEADNVAFTRSGMGCNFKFSLAGEPTLELLQALHFYATKELREETPEGTRASGVLSSPLHLNHEDAVYGISVEGAKQILELKKAEGFHLDGMSDSKGGRVWCSEIQDIPTLEAVIVLLLDHCQKQNYEPVSLMSRVREIERERIEDTDESTKMLYSYIESNKSPQARADGKSNISIHVTYESEAAKPTNQIEALVEKLQSLTGYQNVIRTTTTQLLKGVEPEEAVYVIECDDPNHLDGALQKKLAMYTTALASSGIVILSYVLSQVSSQKAIVFYSKIFIRVTEEGNLQCLRSLALPTGCYFDFVKS